MGGNSLREIVQTAGFSRTLDYALTADTSIIFAGWKYSKPRFYVLASKPGDAAFDHAGRQVEMSYPKNSNNRFLEMNIETEDHTFPHLEINFEKRAYCTYSTGYAKSHSEIHTLFFQPAARYSSSVSEELERHLERAWGNDDEMVKAFIAYGVATIVDFVQRKGLWRPKSGLQAAMLEGFRTSGKYSRKAV
jgi:hypothetical protein